MNVSSDDILEFWFGNLSSSDDVDPSKNDLWWKGEVATDLEIARRFGPLVAPALLGEFDVHATTPRNRLALILVLDQFTRVTGRGTAAAFAGDGKALAITLDAIEAGEDKALRLIERSFFYMPLMHAEDRDIARRSVEIFGALSQDIAIGNGSRAKATGFTDPYEHAVDHAGIVMRFGRFPHRNRVLGRTSTRDEIEYLAESGSSFGQ